MTDDEREEFYKLNRELDLELSVNLGVPRALYESVKGVIDWRGRFDVTINGRIFHMALTPSTLFVNEPDAEAPITHKVGSEWIDTAMGRLFHVDYYTSQIGGGFQIFRMADSLPFQGFEHTRHTHMLVYTNGSGEKQYFPIVIVFAEK